MRQRWAVPLLVSSCLALAASPALAATKAAIMAAWNSGDFRRVVQLIEETPDNALSPGRRLALATAAYNAGQLPKARSHVTKLYAASAGLSDAQLRALDMLDRRLKQEQYSMLVIIGDGTYHYSIEGTVTDVSLLAAEAAVRQCLGSVHATPCDPAPDLPPFE